LTIVQANFWFAFEDVASAFVYDAVHQINEVAILVGLLILLGKFFDSLVNEVTKGIWTSHAIVTTLVQVLEELTNILFTVLLSVWLVQQLKHSDEDVKRLFNYWLLDRWVEEELFEDPDGGQAVLSVAERDQEVVLHLAQDGKPGLKVFILEIYLSASIEDFDVRPLEAFKVVVDDSLLQGLWDEERVPFLWSAVCAVLLSVSTGDVDFFFSASEWVHLQSWRPNVLRSQEQDLKILIGEVRIEIDYLGQVNEADLQGHLGGILVENGVDDVEEDWSVFFDALLGQLDLSCGADSPKA
jgi:hypothetical protein